MPQDFFIQRPQVTPTIYAYRLIGVSSHDGYLKIGYTDRDAETRIKEQLHTSGIPYQIVLKESAIRADGTCFTDHDIHAALRRKDVKTSVVDRGYTDFSEKYQLAEAQKFDYAL